MRGHRPEDKTEPMTEHEDNSYGTMPIRIEVESATSSETSFSSAFD